MAPYSRSANASSLESWKISCSFSGQNDDNPKVISSKAFEPPWRGHHGCKVQKQEQELQQCRAEDLHHRVRLPQMKATREFAGCRTFLKVLGRV